MKKKTIAFIMAIFVILLTLAYTMFNEIFPKADSISKLEINSVEIFNVYDDSNNNILIESDNLLKIIDYINGSTATRIMSVNDYPSVRPYYVVEIKTSERLFRYMIYEEDGTAYIELPYEGVYKIDREVINILN